MALSSSRRRWCAPIVLMTVYLTACNDNLIAAPILCKYLTASCQRREVWDLSTLSDLGTASGTDQIKSINVHQLLVYLWRIWKIIELYIEMNIFFCLICGTCYFFEFYNCIKKQVFNLCKLATLTNMDKILGVFSFFELTEWENYWDHEVKEKNLLMSHKHFHHVKLYLNESFTSL